MLQVETQNRPVDLTMPEVAAGRYQVMVHFHYLNKKQNVPITVSVEGQPPKTVPSLGRKGMVVDLGEINVGKNAPKLTFQSATPFAIDYIALVVAL